MTSTLVIATPPKFRSVLGYGRQAYGHRGAAARPLALGEQGPPIGGDKGAGDPQTQARSGCRGMALTPEAAFAQRAFLFRGQSAAVIVYGHLQVTHSTTAAHFDFSSSRRILCGILQELPERLFDKYGVDMDKRGIARNVENDAVGGQSSFFLFDRGGDDVRRVGPHEMRMNAVGANSRRIKQVANVVIELTGLVMNRLDQGVRIAIALDCRHLIENTATSQYRRQWTAEFVRYSADERVAENLGFIVDRRLLGRLLLLEVLERDCGFLDHGFDVFSGGFDEPSGTAAELDGNGAIAQDLRHDELYQPCPVDERFKDYRALARAGRHHFCGLSRDLLRNSSAFCIAVLIRCRCHEHRADSQRDAP